MPNPFWHMDLTTTDVEGARAKPAPTPLSLALSFRAPRSGARNLRVINRDPSLRSG